MPGFTLRGLAVARPPATPKSKIDKALAEESQPIHRPLAYLGFSPGVGSLSVLHTLIPLAPTPLRSQSEIRTAVGAQVGPL